jgi:FtsP/CotA-like multicopper oxidase with cupredoxin domain
MTIHDALSRLRAGSLSSAELVEESLAAIARQQPRTNAFIRVDAEEARATAKRADAERAGGQARGALHGIPIALKDLVDVAGVPTTAASKVFARNTPARDAFVVSRLKAAGAVLLGKLNMHEFAYGASTVVSAYGPVKNPWAPSYSAGGSSAGSAAAVAAGLCYGSVGSDTGGSIRQPASFCGVVGVTPTYGSVFEYASGVRSESIVLPLREDYGQEMGLYGTIIVRPRDESYWAPADRELTITLDDVMIEDGKMVPFGRSGPNFTAMGRFGNVMLINGEAAFSGEAAPGEVVRLYVVNTANTRIFNFALPDARMKLVGGDSGRYERETFIDEVMLAPSERAVVDVKFEDPGEVRLEHRTPDHVYDLGSFSIAGNASAVAAESFEALRVDPQLTAEHRSIGADIERPPDKVLAFVASMPLLYGDADTPPTSYACPMHPEVTSSEPGTCPKCGMKLVPSDSVLEPESRPKSVVTEHDKHEHGDGLEWEDLMPEINRASDTTNMIWQLIDRETGAENGAISWDFTVGDRVKIRLVNEMEADHPMHHPFHIHGAGRFLVLSRDDEPEENLVWKDTVLVRSGQTVDILLDVSNPGLWMAHCHIAEHNQSGMMFSFNVSRQSGQSPA